MKKSFILGIGSQRAASTFLARLLNQHPEIAIHPLKELHYFDTKFGLRDEKVLKEFSKNQLNREINKLCDAQKLDFITPTWQWYLRSNFQLLTTPISEIKYFDLFADVCHQKDIRFVGESTPEYMLLSEEEIAKMRAFIGNANIIIICRNPVKRIISSFRLLQEYGGGAKKQEKADVDRFFLELIEKDNLWIQKQVVYNNYKNCIINYSKFFEKVLFLSYDHVVEKPQNIIQQLSQFLELDFNLESIQKLFSKKINTLKTTYEPEQQIIDKLEILFKDQSEQLVELFGTPLIY